jgi:hypothetical protein
MAAFTVSYRPIPKNETVETASAASAATEVVDAAPTEEAFWVTMTYDGSLAKEGQKVAKPSIWLVDVSGSMQTSIGELNDVCTAAYERMPNKPQVIQFDDRASHVPMGVTWQRLYVNGRTSFQNAFIEMFDLVSRNKSLQGADVLFFTDGHDNASINLRAYLDIVLWPSLLVNNLTLHVVGYSHDHDITTMAKLVGNNPKNSYQYAPTKKDLADVVGRISELAEPTIDFTLLPGTDKKKGADDFSFLAVGDSADFIWKGPIPDTFELQLKNMTAAITAVGGPITAVGGPITAARNVISIVPQKSDQPLTLSDQVMIKHLELKELALNPSKNALDQFDQQLDLLHQKMMTLRGLPRKAAMGSILEMKKVIASVYAKLRGQMTMDDQARLLTTTNAIRTGKTGLNKKLDQRLLNQNDLRAKAEATILEKIKGLNPDAAPEKATDFVCPLTASNWWESVCDGDCIGVTVVVKRPESAVANAAMLQVLKVNTDVMSLTGFHDALQTGLLRAADENAVHGGFGGTGTVIRDRAIAPCNAVFPLFISDDHWDRTARHLMPLALGFMTTLDERGFANDQWHSIPYLILAQLLIQKPTTEKERFICDAVYRTCKVMVKRETLKDDIKESFLLIHQLRFNRTACGNLRVLLGKIAALHSDSWVNSMVMEARMALYLEFHRRQVRRPGPSETWTRVADFLRITHETDLTPLGVESEQAWKMPDHSAVNAWPNMSTFKACVSDLLGLTIDDNLYPLYHAWALAHCDDEKAVELSSCPNPLTHPVETRNWLTDRAKKHVDMLQNAALMAAQALLAGSSYMTQVDPVFRHGGSHLHNGNTFSIFLHTLRATSNIPGALVNPVEKLNYLRTCGWTPGRRNSYAFRKQVEFALSTQ